MGVDAWALIIAIGAFVVGGYGAVVAHTYARREDDRRRAEVEARPADVRAELGLLSLGEYFARLDEDVVEASEDARGDLAVVFRNHGGTPISIERVEQLTVTDLPIGPSEMLMRVSDTGPELPAVLQPVASNSARYSASLKRLAQVHPYVPVIEDGQIRYGFRAVLSDGTEVISRSVTLRLPERPDAFSVTPAVRDDGSTGRRDKQD